MSLPNQLSMFRLLLAPVFLILFLSENVFYKKLSFVIFFIAVLTDWYDGWHARKFGLISKFGIFIDPLADKILTSAAFIGFYIMGFMPLWMVIVIVVRDIIITLLRSYNELNGRTMSTSFMAKLKTFIQMSYIFLILIIFALQIYTENDSLKTGIENFLHSTPNYYLMLFVTLITLYTGISYFFEKKFLTI